MIRFVPLLALVALTACDPASVPSGPPDVPSLPDAADDTCGAAPHAALVGQKDTALERVLIMRQVRVIRPGMAVTADYRPERINFIISESGDITRITCG